MSDDRIPAFDRATYQRAARAVLTHPLITETHPDGQTLPLVRRWAEPLRSDLSRLFDYRLDITPTTARLFRVYDGLDASRPAMAGANQDRPFDRRRYAYLALAIAVLGRSAPQLSLSELSERVIGEAARIADLDFVAENRTHRAAFVDAVGWLETRGAVRLADGNARRWADDPTAGEALYDIDLDVLRAVYRPTRVLQHLGSVTDLLHRPDAQSRDTRRLAAAQRIRRALVERTVVYDAELDPADLGSLRTPSIAAEVAELTGMVVERRAEGLALLDVSGRFSDRRFPGPGTVSQAALLLINRMADRILDPDAPPLPRLPAPPSPSAALVSALDAGLPTAEAGFDVTDGSDGAGRSEPPDVEQGSSPAAAAYPLLDDRWLTATLGELIGQYGPTFAGALRLDPPRLLREIVVLLTELKMVVAVDGGVLALPLAARYRNAVIDTRTRERDHGLFDLPE